ncbi:MAG: glycoside hydrolase family 5 protein [Anaerolineales bacterium]
MKRVALVSCLFLLIGCSLNPVITSPKSFATSVSQADIFAANQRLTRTVNLGNALEAPYEGEWGVTLQEEYFQTIANAGFTAVRVPIRFSAHADEKPPYTLNSVFLARVDWAVQNAIKNGLVAILDMHHYLEIFDDPASHRGRFIALWQQIAGHYQGYPDSRVYFELLNEPNGNLDAAKWNDLLAETLAVVRQSNPTRPVIIGTTNWGGADGLSFLQLPNDPNLIVTFHYYLPFEFTHQGAEWVDGSDAWFGTTWDGTLDQVTTIANDFDSVSAWAAENNRPIFLGEFGAYSKGDQASRVRWTTAVRQAAEERSFSWGYWEFCSGFGVYDPVVNRWREDLLQALIPTP